MIKNRKRLDAIKQEYIIGNISLDSLIKKYNMPSATVYRHSSKDNWKKQREEYRIITYKLYFSKAVAKDKMNELIIIILDKAKKILHEKRFNAKELYYLTETIKMCKENLNHETTT